jgi:histone deacetylase 1/2
LHRFVVNPQIPAKYDSEAARELDEVSAAYDAWLVQDQMLFTWLLSTLAESVLPRTISCRHAFQVWDEIHNYFTAQTKAKIRQLRSELKTVKKGTKTITEFILRVRAVANTLISIGDSVSEQDQIDSILDGLPEEYNPFVMMMYGRSDSPSLFDDEYNPFVRSLFDIAAIEINTGNTKKMMKDEAEDEEKGDLNGD